MIDLGIVGGTVIDGTGAPRRLADVGIDSGRIVAIASPGTLPEARSTIDARSRIVTPGFVDPHTHMDAQLWWDPSGAPSVLHGVTTVVIGSCGFGVAPVAPGDAEYVLRSLESVEEIPYDVSHRSVPMTWQSWPEFFDQLGTLPLGVNVAGFVPHSALLAGVLPKSGRRGGLTAAERDQIRAALRDCLDAGAVGMSTSRGTNHTDAFGAPVPSRTASDEELLDLVQLCSGRLWQINIASKGDNSELGIRSALAELKLYDEWARSTGAHVTWTPLIVGPGDQVAWRRLLAFAEEHDSTSTAQVSPQPIVGAISFDGPSFAALIDGWAPAFVGYGDLSADERRVRLSSQSFRDCLKASPENASRATAPNFDRWRVAVSPAHPTAVGLSIREFAKKVGRSPVDAMIDLVLADDFATVVEAPLSNLDEEALQFLVTSESTLLGLGDAGAHIKSISNYTYPTTVIGDLCHRRGWMSLERGVEELTSSPAQLFNLDGRGLLREGFHADVCVIDLDKIGLGLAEVVADLPGGGKRLHRSAHGFDAVIVNGQIAVDHDELLATEAGELIRVRR